MGRVVVVGSVNVDLVAFGERIPSDGETLTGTRFEVYDGGKGANQAVMAAHLGAPTALVGCIGDDDLGQRALRHLTAQHLELQALRTVAGTSTGVALINVAANGANAITVVPGANGVVNVNDVLAADIAADDVVVVVLEIPLGVGAAALAMARGSGARSVLTPAPVPAGGLSSAFDGVLDIVVLNESELVALGGAAELFGNGASTVIVTQGAAGALLIDRTGEHRQLPTPPPVVAVDTTGAGDAFAGALAAGLLAGRSIIDAATSAIKVATITVTKPGAQASYPMHGDLPAALQVDFTFSRAEKGNT
jgi:ribokinase